MSAGVIAACEPLSSWPSTRIGDCRTRGLLRACANESIDEGANSQVPLHERSPLFVLHCVELATEYATNHSAHMIALEDGCVVAKLPGGASLLGVSGVSLKPRGSRPETAKFRRDSCIRSWIRTPRELELGVGGSNDVPFVGGHVLARNPMWEMSAEWRLPGSFFVDSTCDDVAWEPLEASILRQGVAYTLSKCGAQRCAPWRNGSAGLSHRERQVSAVLLERARQDGLEIASARIRASRSRAWLATSVMHAISAWPPSLTYLISNTWWNPYLRPKTWAPTAVAEKAFRREARRRASGKQQPTQGVPQMASGRPEGESAQKADEIAAQTELAAQAQAIQLQLEAETQERAKKQLQAMELRDQQLLQSAVKSALFYLLRYPEADDEDVPLMHVAGMTPPDRADASRPRITPHGYFFAGLPDAAQEMCPPILPELTRLTEGPKKPVTAAAKAEARQKRAMTARVTRIRGSNSTMYGRYASLVKGGRTAGGAPALPEVVQNRDVPLAMQEIAE